MFHSFTSTDVAPEEDELDDAPSASRVACVAEHPAHVMQAITAHAAARRCFMVPRTFEIPAR